MIKLTQQQQDIHNQVIDWFKSYPSQYLSVGGLAGTGKSTLIGFITKTLKNIIGDVPIAYCTYTGKASLVLNNKIQQVSSGDFIGTIHSLIYKPIVDISGQITGWHLKVNIPYSLIILDEASMINKDIFNDLKSYGIPILAIGDQGQLPPIGNDNFSLMKKPDLLLTKIHRQAQLNPIIKLSMMVRDNGSIPTKTFGKSVAKIDYSDIRAQKILDRYNYKTDSQILCGLNKTRVKLNTHIREKNNFERKDPYKNEKLICLKNNKESNIMNGQICFLNSAKIETNFLLTLNLSIFGENRNIYCLTHRKCFGKTKYDIPAKEVYNDKILKGFKYSDKKPKINLFDYGYCCSVHKSQGSEWHTVLLIDERNYYQSDEDYARWLYTGITRARQRLVIISNYF